MKINKLQKSFRMFTEQFRPLWDKANDIGWYSLSTNEKKHYSLLSHRIRKLDRKIALLNKDHYNIAY